jgi:hypothetical protein
MAGMSLWLPQGRAGIDHLVLPLILFPLIWATLFFYAVLETQKLRLYTVMTMVLLLHTFMVALAIWGV